MQVHHIIPRELWDTGKLLSKYSYGSEFGCEHKNNKIDLHNHNGSHNYYTGKVREAAAKIVEYHAKITNDRDNKSAVLKALSELAGRLNTFLKEIDKHYAHGDSVPLDYLFESHFYKYKLESTFKDSQQTARLNKEEFERIITYYIWLYEND